MSVSTHFQETKIAPCLIMRFFFFKTKMSLEFSRFDEHEARSLL